MVVIRMIDKRFVSAASQPLKERRQLEKKERERSGQMTLFTVQTAPHKEAPKSVILRVRKI